MFIFVLCSSSFLLKWFSCFHACFTFDATPIECVHAQVSLLLFSLFSWPQNIRFSFDRRISFYFSKFKSKMKFNSIETRVHHKIIDKKKGDKTAGKTKWQPNWLESKAKNVKSNSWDEKSLSFRFIRNHKLNCNIVDCISFTMPLTSHRRNHTSPDSFSPFTCSHFVTHRLVASSFTS